MKEWTFKLIQGAYFHLETAHRCLNKDFTDDKHIIILNISLFNP